MLVRKGLLLLREVVYCRNLYYRIGLNKVVNIFRRGISIPISDVPLDRTDEYPVDQKL